MRFVLTPDGSVEVDPRDHLQGRGANLSMTVDAFDLAVKKKAFERSLKLGRSLAPAEVERLRNDFQEAIKEREFRKGNQSVTIKIDKETLDKATAATTDTSTTSAI
jgi:predicted RNA-binding protein YlxR (DUF448 family)